MESTAGDYNVALSLAAEESRKLRTENPGFVEELVRQLSSAELDQAVEDRLLDANITTSPLVPHVNGAYPTTETSTTAHERLAVRLAMYGLCERQVRGDGNCQFRALADQLYRNPDHHDIVRTRTVEHLRKHPELYAQYVPDDYWHYCTQMSRCGTWGDHVTLQATSDAFGLKIMVLTSFADSCFIEIQPQSCRSQRVLFISFFAEVHYNSIYPQQEAPLDGNGGHDKILGSKRLHRLIHAFG